MIEKISLSTSLSSNFDWDPFYSIDKTKKSKIDWCQVFIGENFVKDSLLSEKVAKKCKDSVSLIAHSPVDLNNNALDDIVLKNIKQLLTYNKKLVVFHHDYTYPIEKTLKVVKELNNYGVTVLIENFYANKEKEEVLKNIQSFKDMLLKSKDLDLDLFPLLDIPRLFIRDIAEEMNSLEETINLLKYISELNVPLYLHLIDCQDFSQGRDSWCAIGSGIIPYKEIFSTINNLKINIPLVVLEFEDMDHVDESIKYLEGI